MRFFQQKKFNMAQKVVLSAEKNSTCAENVLLSAEMLNMLDHVGSSVWKMCFFLLKCWICWICWIFLVLWEAKRDQLEAKQFNIFNIFNISAETSTFLEKGIQHDLTYSTFQQKEALFWKKSFFQGEKMQHNPKGGSFCRKNSTWPKKWFFQQKIQHVPKCVSFLWKVSFQVLFCFLLVSVSVSVSLSLSRYLFLCTSDPFFFCTSPLVCLSLSLSLLSLSTFLSLSVVTPSLCSSTFLHYTLSFLLTFSV